MMNRLAQRRSATFLMMSWFFVVALFADGANLDDLIPGNIVMHDDEDALSATPSGAEASNFSSNVPGAVTRSQLRLPLKNARPLPSPASARVIVDQDSPSIAPDVEPTLVPANALAANERVFVERTHTTLDDLYLRDCSLLI